jgi:uncharacterized protein (DUF3084 family)
MDCSAAEQRLQGMKAAVSRAEFIMNSDRRGCALEISDNGRKSSNNHRKVRSTPTLLQIPRQVPARRSGFFRLKSADEYPRFQSCNRVPERFTRLFTFLIHVKHTALVFFAVIVISRQVLLMMVRMF